MFQPNMKSNLLQTFSVATLLLKHVLFLQPGLFFPQPRRIYYLPMTKIILFINFCVAAIVRTWEVHSRGCRNALSNRFAGRSETIILPKIALIIPVPERQTELFKLLPMSLLLDNMFWKANTVTPNSLFLLVDELLSIFPLFKLLLSNLYNLIYVNTRNCFQSKTHSLTLFYFCF